MYIDVYTEAIAVEDYLKDKTKTVNCNYKTTYDASNDQVNLYVAFDQFNFDQRNFPGFDNVTFYAEADKTTPLKSEIIKTNNTGNIYRVENIPIGYSPILICPSVTFNKNVYHFGCAQYLELRIEPKINDLLDAQLYKFATSFQDPKSDVQIRFVFDDESTQDITLAQDELVNGNEKKVFLQQMYNEVKIDITYAAEAPSHDPQGIIPDDLLRESNIITYHESTTHTYKPEQSFGTMEFESFTETIHETTTDPVKKYRDITFKTTGSINSYYYAAIINPETGKKIKATIINQLTITYVPYEYTDFEVRVYKTNWTETEVDDEIVYKTIFHAPHQE